MLICFDLDGVLVDACDWHKIALEKAMMEVIGYTISDELHKTRFNGLPTKKKLRLLGLDDDLINEVSVKKQEYTIKTIEELCHEDLGKVQLMRYLRGKDISIACVTNSIKRTAKLMLERSGISWYISHLISNEDINNPKPSAEGYITAMVYAKNLPRETIIVEDSEHGLAAANATGARVLRVKNATEVNINLFKEYL